MMLGEPHALKPLLLGVGNLLERLMDALDSLEGVQGFRNLDLVEQANSHRLISLATSSACHPGGGRDPSRPWIPAFAG